jgi:dipeptidyl aminopeptidase/acylaminoacyl peptidase
MTLKTIKSPELPKRKSLSLVISFLLAIPCFEGMAQVTMSDYQRADSIMKLNDLVYHQVTNVNWIDSTFTFWYQVRTKEGVLYNLADAEKKSVKPAFETGKLVQQLNKQPGIKTTSQSLQLRRLKYDQKTNRIQFIFQQAYWSCNLKDYSLAKDSAVSAEPLRPFWNDPFDELGNKPVPSPDSVWTAYVRDYNVCIRNKKDKKEVQLSFDGSPGDYYSSYLKWSPDSRKLAVNKIRKNEDRFIYFVESSPKNQLQPILQKRHYLKPGDALPIKRPSLFDILSFKQIPVDSQPFENQYDLSEPKWNRESTAFTFDFNQRGHQVYQVAEVDGNTGEVRIIVDERSNTFIDYSGKNFRYDLEAQRQIIWASERDGWNHLYLIDVQTGKIINQITKGNWVVREVVKVDEKNRFILFKASGQNPGEDPYYVHYCKINFDGTGFMDLTPERMEHQAFFSADYTYFTDTYSTVTSPPVTVLRRTSDGSVVMELEKADISDLMAKGWIAPEPFMAKGRDGMTEIWGNIYRPTTFDPTRKYPVIEYIYAGPQGSFAQKPFRVVNTPFSGLAELGFIIVQLDGMGTSNRSKAFHDVCYKNLKDAGFPDRILWIKAAAEKHLFMDTTRIGLFGSSAGGQSTLAGLLFHPEFYKAGASSSGCHDNRMDKMWWNEQWLGFPVGPQYAENSNVVNAGKLKGKLLLIVGELDDNVDPASTMQVVNTLIAAKKEFDLVVLPGVNHTLGGEYGEQKRRDFFVKAFYNQPAPDWNNLTR